MEKKTIGTLASSEPQTLLLPAGVNNEERGRLREAEGGVGYEPVQLISLSLSLSLCALALPLRLIRLLRLINSQVCLQRVKHEVSVRARVSSPPSLHLSSPTQSFLQWIFIWPADTSGQLSDSHKHTHTHSHAWRT